MELRAIARTLIERGLILTALELKEELLDRGDVVPDELNVLFAGDPSDWRGVPSSLLPSSDNFPEATNVTPLASSHESTLTPTPDAFLRRRRSFTAALATSDSHSLLLPASPPSSSLVMMKSAGEPLLQYHHHLYIGPNVDIHMCPLLAQTLPVLMPRIRPASNRVLALPLLQSVLIHYVDLSSPHTISDESSFPENSVLFEMWRLVLATVGGGGGGCDNAAGGSHGSSVPFLSIAAVEPVLQVVTAVLRLQPIQPPDGRGAALDVANRTLSETAERTLRLERQVCTARSVNPMNPAIISLQQELTSAKSEWRTAQTHVSVLLQTAAPLPAKKDAREARIDGEVEEGEEGGDSCGACLGSNRQHPAILFSVCEEHVIACETGGGRGADGRDSSHPTSSMSASLAPIVLILGHLCTHLPERSHAQDAVITPEAYASFVNDRVVPLLLRVAKGPACFGPACLLHDATTQTALSILTTLPPHMDSETLLNYAFYVQLSASCEMGSLAASALLKLTPLLLSHADDNALFYQHFLPESLHTFGASIVQFAVAHAGGQDQGRGSGGRQQKSLACSNIESVSSLLIQMVKRYCEALLLNINSSSSPVSGEHVSGPRKSLRPGVCEGPTRAHLIDTLLPILWCCVGDVADKLAASPAPASPYLLDQFTDASGLCRLPCTTGPVTVTCQLCLSLGPAATLGHIVPACLAILGKPVLDGEEGAGASVAPLHMVPIYVCGVLFNGCLPSPIKVGLVTEVITAVVWRKWGFNRNKGSGGGSAVAAARLRGWFEEDFSICIIEALRLCCARDALVMIELLTAMASDADVRLRKISIAVVARCICALLPGEVTSGILPIIVEVSKLPSDGTSSDVRVETVAAVGAILQQSVEHCEQCLAILSKFVSSPSDLKPAHLVAILNTLSVCASTLPVASLQGFLPLLRQHVALELLPDDVSAAMFHLVQVLCSTRGLTSACLKADVLPLVLSLQSAAQHVLKDEWLPTLRELCDQVETG